MTTREDYRNLLENKIVGIEDSGYGDFEFTLTEYNTYLDLACARLFPAIWKRSIEPAQTLTSYGGMGLGYVLFPMSERVYLVEDSGSLDIVRGWESRSGRVMGVDMSAHSTVDLHFYEAYTLPAGDQDPSDIPAEFTPLVVQGALIEAMEARHDTGVRGDEPWPDGFVQTPLLDRLVARFETMKQEMQMNLPVVDQ